jgi:YebC/PmpR family DNA-binding regulatory protein
MGALLLLQHYLLRKRIMSGHSKWSTIKHKKAKTDAQRGKIFTKIVREITTAARLGGGDDEANPRLRLALQKAKEVNMPNDNIKRAIQKGAGTDDDGNFEEITFEGYASDGVALLIEVLTDNRNRTVPNIRSVLSKFGGNLAAKGAVSYLFDKKGVLLVEPGPSEDAVMNIALNVDVDDVISRPDGSFEILTVPEHFESVYNAFKKSDVACASASITMVPQTTVLIPSEKAEKLMALIEKLEEDDDVQAVYSNADFPDDVLSTL